MTDLTVVNGQGLPSEEPPKKLSKEEKINAKNILRINARIQELVATGLSEEQAYAQVDEEEFDKLPIDRKLLGVRRAFQHLQNLFASTVKSINNDVNSLVENDSLIAGSMDINFLAIGMALADLGISDQKQSEYLSRARKIASSRNPEEEAKTQTEEELVKSMVHEEDSPPPIIS